MRWEACRIIGNVASKLPDRAREALPKLLANTKDTCTVVRWSAAFALTEIAKGSEVTGKELISEFKKILERENNNGVKNMYLKYFSKNI